jgi:hypothetical protein
VTVRSLKTWSLGVPLKRMFRRKRRFDAKPQVQFGKEKKSMRLDVMKEAKNGTRGTVVGWKIEPVFGAGNEAGP